ncbi:MAG TPA: neuromedin U [Candidatus Binatia bacterium]|nr:neuromedin U [Candidatus Binatia bacterium]
MFITRTPQGCQRDKLVAALGSFYLIVALSTLAAGQRPNKQEPSAEELVKQTQNPVADLISVPFQNNFNFAAGPKHNHQVYLLNVQPVIPINLTDNWNLIARIITPVINLPSLAPGIGSATGLGDINPTFFLSPAKSGDLIWGVGPTFTLPTASDKLLGNGKFSLGPAAVALTMQGPWVVGALMNNQWSVAGWSSGHVNQMLIQPFVNYNLPDHWYLVSAPIMTANWPRRMRVTSGRFRSAVASANCSRWVRYFR